MVNHWYWIKIQEDNSLHASIGAGAFNAVWCPEINMTHRARPSGLNNRTEKLPVTVSIVPYQFIISTLSRNTTSGELQYTMEL